MGVGSLYLSIEKRVLIHHPERSSTQNIWHMSLKDDERKILRATQFCFKQYISLCTKKITHKLSIYIWRQTIKTFLCNCIKLQQQINVWKFLLDSNLLFFLETVWITFLLKFVFLRWVDNIRLNTIFQKTQRRCVKSYSFSMCWVQWVKLFFVQFELWVFVYIRWEFPLLSMCVLLRMCNMLGWV